MMSTFNPFSRKRARAGPASFAERPPPAAGLTMAKKRSIWSAYKTEILTPVCQSTLTLLLQRQNRRAAVQLRQAFRQNVAFNLERSRPRKVLVHEDDAMDTLVV